MITMVAHDVGVEDEPPLLLVGMSESRDDEGQAFYFQCDLRHNDYSENSNWPEGESYCVSNEGGLTRYGCVREIEAQGNTLRVQFTEGAVRDLQLADSDFTFEIANSEDSFDEITRQLRRVLTCGRPEYHPHFFGM